MADVLSHDELLALLDRFGMRIQLDPDGDTSPELLTARLAHALVGLVETHASRAEAAARQAGATAEDIASTALMAFAGANCETEPDEWALIQWRAVRLSMVLSLLDFAGPRPRDRQAGSGDDLTHTIRQVAAALSGITTAKNVAMNPHRPAAEYRAAGKALLKALTVLEQAAADAPAHREVGWLMTGN